MENAVSPSYINALNARLDQELTEHLQQALQDHIEVEIVQSRKLSTGAIFAVETEYQRITVLTAYIPVSQRTGAECVFSQASVKYFCAGYKRNSRTELWQRDTSYGESGHQVFTLANIDDDSVAAVAGLIADNILEQFAQFVA